MNLSAEAIEGLTVGLLAAKYDNPKPIPDLHRELWAEFCSDAPKVAGAAPRGHAKAQSLYSKILTFRGWREIGHLRVGDLVIGRDGQSVPVTHLHPIDEMDLYRVSTADGKSTLCNLDHLWEVEIPSNQKGLQVKPLRDILENWKHPRLDKRSGREFNEYRYRIRAIDPPEFEESELEVDPYTLGIWLGDGHSASGRITTADPYIAKRLGAQKQSGEYLYVVPKLFAKLKSLDLINDKHLPEEYLFSSKGQRLEVLRGLMDSDGTCNKKHGQASFSNTNKGLIDGIVALVRSLGGIATVSEAEAKLYGKSCGPYWRVTVKMSVCPFALDRKKRYWTPHKRIYSYITGIEYEKRDLGRCITVEGGLYVTDDYLLTHNSTAITHAAILACMLFRVKSFCLLVSDTEAQAAEFLGDIKAELTGNTTLRSTFGIKKVIKDTETNIICQFKDGEMFRIVAKGSMQKVRGLKWRGKRPDLIVGDDLENDDIVMNPERREKFRRWFMNALIPCGSDTCSVRIVGTILHLDSMLQRLLDAPTWRTKVYEAHNHDFSEILWPEQFPQERLLAIRAGYEEQNDLDGYSQEYLNKPVAHGNAYFNPDYFYDFERDKNDKWLKPNLEYYAAADFAISEKEKADYTVITVAGVDPTGMVYIVNVNKFRGDADVIIEELINTQKHYKPNVFTFETEKIDKAIGPSLNRAMMRERTFLNINTITPTKSKTTRGRSIQALHKAGAIKYDKDSSWFPDFYSELQTITDSGPRGKNDDMFDSFAYIGLTIDKYFDAQSDKEIEEEEREEEYDNYADQGRCFSTGY